jgi:hypothetical protein
MTVTGRRQTGQRLPTSPRPHAAQEHSILSPGQGLRLVPAGDACVRAARVHAQRALVERSARDARRCAARARKCLQRQRAAGGCRVRHAHAMASSAALRAGIHTAERTTAACSTAAAASDTCQFSSCVCGARVTMCSKRASEVEDVQLTSARDRATRASFSVRCVHARARASDRRGGCPCAQISLLAHLCDGSGVVPRARRSSEARNSGGVGVHSRPRAAEDALRGNQR